MNQQLNAESAGTTEALHRYVNALQMLSIMTRRKLRLAATAEARESLTYVGELVDIFGELFSHGEEDRDLSKRVSNICRSWQRLCNGKVEIVFEPGHDVGDSSQHQIVKTSLIVQELLLNAIKHAFPGDRTGTIRVGLKRGAVNHAILTVSDDGVGAVASAESDPNRNGRAHKGTDIIQALATDLGGTIQRGSNGGTGHKVSIRWPL